MSTVSAQDRQWIDDMVVELRLRDVSGPAIGDAVASVESHLSESHESARDAFGDPRSYARSLVFTDEQRATMTLRDWASALLPSLVGLLGLGLSTSAVRAYRLDTDTAITLGPILSLLFIALFVALSVRFLGALLRRPLAGFVWFCAGFAGAASLAIVVRTPAFAAPRALVAALSVLLLVGGAIAETMLHSRLVDPITDPRDGSDRYSAPRASRAGRALGRSAGWIIVAAAILLGIVTWWTA